MRKLMTVVTIVASLLGITMVGHASAFYTCPGDETIDQGWKAGVNGSFHTVEDTFYDSGCAPVSQHIIVDYAPYYSAFQPAAWEMWLDWGQAKLVVTSVPGCPNGGPNHICFGDAIVQARYPSINGVNLVNPGTSAAWAYPRGDGTYVKYGSGYEYRRPAPGLSWHPTTLLINNTTRPAYDMAG